MIIENKLGLTSQVELAKTEEKLSKQKAKELYDSGKINEIEVGTFKGLSEIHEFLFSEIYEFAGNIRWYYIGSTRSGIARTCDCAWLQYS